VTPPNETRRARPGHEISVVRARLGTALQRNRLRSGLTQAEVAERAGLSMKYVGAVERGEANNTIDVLERLAAVLDWNPLDAEDNFQEPLSEGVRLLLLDDVQTMQEQLANITKWLQALDPALQSKVKAPARPRMAEGGAAGRPTRRRAKREMR
jgi:transcriptional regulator with XRE-family HTH domain